MVQEKNERSSEILAPASFRPATRLRHEDLRRELLAEAIRVIEAQGLPALRARDLARIVGCSVGAIYNAFTDLDALILTVNARTLAALNERMAGVTEATPAAHFVALAEAYTGYALTNQRLWDALFSFRPAPGTVLPAWFQAVQGEAFSHIEAPLGRLRPDLPLQERQSLARSIFAAVHGVVAFGVEERIGPLDAAALRRQVRIIAGAIAQGLAGDA